MVLSAAGAAVAKFHDENSIIALQIGAQKRWRRLPGVKFGLGVIRFSLVVLMGPLLQLSSKLIALKPNLLEGDQLESRNFFGNSGVLPQTEVHLSWLDEPGIGAG